MRELGNCNFFVFERKWKAFIYRGRHNSLSKSLIFYIACQREKVGDSKIPMCGALDIVTGYLEMDLNDTCRPALCPTKSSQYDIMTSGPHVCSAI